MGVLTAAAPAIVICTRDRARSAAFYGDVLGLTLIREDALATVFEVGGAQLRISTVPDFTPHEHTILGFRVPDVRAAVAALAEKGVGFARLAGAPHDELGVLTLPGGAVHVAWMKDPDGALLSITDAP
jgi:catechol 2,3-dioxygenase-like lactoylglutathione lyase family enzyme